MTASLGLLADPNADLHKLLFEPFDTQREHGGQFFGADVSEHTVTQQRARALLCGCENEGSCGAINGRAQGCAEGESVTLIVC